MIIFFINAVTDGKFSYKKWLIVFVLSSLALAANLSYLYSILGIAGYFIFLLLTSLEREYSLRKREVRTIGIYFLLLITFAIADLLFIRFYGKDLGYGGDTDLIMSLMGSVWDGSLYFSHYSYITNVLAYISFILLDIAILYFLFLSIKKYTINIALIISIPIISIILLNIVFHLILNTPFLLSRTAIQWYPLGMLVLFLFFEVIIRPIKINLYSQFFIGCIFSLLIIIHFVRQADIHYCFEWPVLAETQNQLKDLAACHPQKPGDDVSWAVYKNYYLLVDSNIARIPIIAMVRDEQFITFSPSEFRKKMNFDFIIISPLLLNRIKELDIPYKVIRQYKLTNYSLIELLDYSQTSRN